MEDMISKGMKTLSAVKGAAVAAPTAGAAFNALIPAVGLAVPAGPAIIAVAILGAGAYAGYKLGGWAVGEIADVIGLPRK